MTENIQLIRLLALITFANDNSIPFPDGKLVGDGWDTVTPGRWMRITWTNPYKVEYGFLFTLPGMCWDIFKNGVVQIPSRIDDPENQSWYTLKHLAIIASTLELEPEL